MFVYCVGTIYGVLLRGAINGSQSHTEIVSGNCDPLCCLGGKGGGGGKEEREREWCGGGGSEED